MYCTKFSHSYTYQKLSACISPYLPTGIHTLNDERTTKENLHILTLIFLSHPKRPYEVLVSSTEVLNEVKQKRLRVPDGSSLPLYSSATQSPLRLPTVSPHHGEVRRGGMRPNLQAKNQYSHCHFSSCSLWRYQKTISFILKCSYFFQKDGPAPLNNRE